MPTYPLSELREIARWWCDYATDGDKGRRLDDPIYQKITEYRDHGGDYSSCADLPHWMLYRLGCREPFVNLDEAKGFREVIGVNLLVAPPIGSNKYAELWTPESSLESLETGDILVYWSNAKATNTHTDVFDSYKDGVLTTWDYGQGPFGDVQIGDVIEAKKRSRTPASMTRPIKSVLRLSRVPFTGPAELPPGFKLPEGENNTPLVIGLGLLALLALYYLSKKGRAP